MIPYVYFTNRFCCSVFLQHFHFYGCLTKKMTDTSFGLSGGKIKTAQQFLKAKPLIIRLTETNLQLHNVLLIGKAMNPFILIMYHLLLLKITLLCGRS